MKTPEELQKRLIILVTVKFVAGILLFLRDKHLGLAILIAAVIGLSWLLFVNYKIKKNQPFDFNKTFAFFHSSIGIFIFLFGILVFILEGLAKLRLVYLKLIVGVLLTLRGVYHLKRHSSKK